MYLTGSLLHTSKIVILRPYALPIHMSNSVEVATDRECVLPCRGNDRCMPQICVLICSNMLKCYKIATTLQL